MPGVWLILYDEDCGFCTWLLAGVLACDRAARLRPLALQRDEAAARLADLAPAQRLGSWHLISPTGQRYSAGAAFAPLLRLLPRGGPLATLPAALPGATERAYRWVADRRVLLSRAVPAAAKRRARERVRRREQVFQ